MTFIRISYFLLTACSFSKPLDKLYNFFEPPSPSRKIPEEPEIKLPTSVGSLKKQESSRKISTSALLTMPKPLTMWTTTKCGKFWKIWEYQTTWPASWEICLQVKKQQLELDMEQHTGSKLGKECIKAGKKPLPDLASMLLQCPSMVEGARDLCGVSFKRH